jgi:hypothetical protein
VIRFVAIFALAGVVGCSSQERIAENTTVILKAVRSAREDLYVIAQEHPDVLPQLKAVSDKLMVAVDAAYSIEVDLPGVEDQHEYLDTFTTIAFYVGGAIIVSVIGFILWRSGFLNAVAMLMPARKREDPK